MNIVYAVRADSPQAPALAQLIDLPLGLDIWQVQADQVVLRAEEEQAARLRQMGYTTEELVETENHVATFATAEAIAAYHSAETLEHDLRQLAESQPEIAELREIGRSLEDRPIWALRIGERRSGTLADYGSVVSSCAILSVTATNPLRVGCSSLSHQSL